MEQAIETYERSLRATSLGASRPYRLESLMPRERLASSGRARRGGVVCREMVTVANSLDEGDQRSRYLEQRCSPAIER